MITMSMWLQTLLIALSIWCSNAELYQVQILFRHGDRSPIALYPTDPNKLDKWTYGLGELSHIGIRQHYELGRWLRKRYNKFLGNNYNNSLLFTRSSNIDRTLMSAESNLAGIYRNVTQLILPGLKWRPVPVHTVPKDEDLMLLEVADCKSFPKLLHDKYETPYYSKRIGKYQNMLKYIASKSGIDSVTTDNYWKIYDSVFCEKSHNFTISPWITKSLWKKMTELHEILWEGMFEGELGRISAGLMLKKMINHMEMHIKKFQNNEVSKDLNSDVGKASLLLYFGHDTDVAPLARLLVNNYTNNYANRSSWQPPYASAIILELHKNPWGVKVFYKPGPPDIPSKDDVDIPAMKIEGCDEEFCRFEKFRSVILRKTMSRSEYERRCGNKDFLSSRVMFAFVIFTICLLLFICSMVIYQSCIAIYHKNRSSKQIGYSHLKNDIN